MSLDRAIAMAAVLLYGVLVVAFLPPGRFGHMLGGGSVLFCAIASVGYVLRSRAASAFSILLVSFLGAAVLLMPNFPAMGGEHLAGVPIGFLGSQAAALIWIALRWRPDPQPGPRTALLEAILAGAFGAVALSAIASIPLAFGLLSGDPQARKLLWVYPAYFAGTLSAAFLYWLLQGIRHRPVGRYLIGALGGLCVYGAVAPVVAIVNRDPISLREIAMIGIVCGCLVGPPVALSASDESAP